MRALHAPFCFGLGWVCTFCRPVYTSPAGAGLSDGLAGYGRCSRLLACCWPSSQPYSARSRGGSLFLSQSQGSCSRCMSSDGPAESVRVSVRELGTTPAETNRKQFPSRVDFIGSCRLLLFAVCCNFALI